MRVLALGTYPIQRPIHGGQRRVSAIRAAYGAKGVPFRYVAIYDPNSENSKFCGADDIPLRSEKINFHNGIDCLTDVRAGLFACVDSKAFSQLLRIFDEVNPTHIQLEQPYLLPFVEKLFSENIRSRIPVVYSSQNIEAPLKEAVVIQRGASKAVAKEIALWVEDLERRCVAASEVVLAAASSDAAEYGSWGHSNVIACRNGFNPTPSDPAMKTEIPKMYGSNRFIVIVGSPHPPNIEGILHYVVRDGLFFVPPIKSLAIVGGVAHKVFASPEYLNFADSYSPRVHFFPDVTDGALSAIRELCHGFALPIRTGGGTNLKTAEALFYSKWVVGTPHAFRGFEEYLGDPGVIVEDTPRLFKKALQHALNSALPELDPEAINRRTKVTWEWSLRPLTNWIEGVVAAENHEQKRASLISQ